MVCTHPARTFAEKPNDAPSSLSVIKKKHRRSSSAITLGKQSLRRSPAMTATESHREASDSAPVWSNRPKPSSPPIKRSELFVQFATLMTITVSEKFRYLRTRPFKVNHILRSLLCGAEWSPTYPRKVAISKKRPHWGFPASRAGTDAGCAVPLIRKWPNEVPTATQGKGVAAERFRPIERQKCCTSADQFRS